MIPSAGAMFPTHNLQSQNASTSLNRRARSAGEEVEPGKKPKKVNSEIRKQQNRIASRNYREKRKRKLQYLQQLVKDGDSPEQEPAQRIEQMHGQRVLTPEYTEQRPATRTMALPSNETYATLTSTSGGMNSMPATTSSGYGHSYRPSQPLQSYEPSWPVSMYEPMPPVNISTWNVPNWMPSIDYTPPMTSQSDTFQFTPPHSHHSFDEISSPPQQARTPEPDLFLLGTCRRADGCIPSASLPSSTTSSPYRHMQYAHGL